MTPKPATVSCEAVPPPCYQALEADLYRLAEWETAHILARGASSSTGISFGLLQRYILDRRARYSQQRINSRTFCQWWAEIEAWLDAEEARIFATVKRSQSAVSQDRKQARIRHEPTRARMTDSDRRTKGETIRAL